MLNYEYPPLGGGGSNACKYILKEFAKKNLEVDLVTSSPANTFETEKMGSTISIYKLPINKKDIHYWTQREIITYRLKAHSFIKNFLKHSISSLLRRGYDPLPRGCAADGGLEYKITCSILCH
ncbi:MAG: hypothetical protein MPEBLZ_02412 [Candidatus Methanoperedens nitroreducens]|uniref:Uncharacterized protein n=2 Tax=Candidatus Methanoperedens TaxID=1392997 RepID=A0A0P8A8T5_9EURY|nr:MAG: hypothetical protein MPEBLZ_02412 [Candidatus Methanoperedens sp. BLZ1]